MDIIWQESIQINAPISEVYRYLADFPRHIEWAQTLARLELIRPGDSTGVGTRYRTYERQAMQADRKPREVLTQGMRVTTICEIRELTPNRRIVWHAHTDPKALGLYADLEFEFAASATGGALVTQRYHFHQPQPVAFMFRLMYGRNMAEKGYAQWAAGLANIKTILEESAVDRAVASSMAGNTVVSV